MPAVEVLPRIGRILEIDIKNDKRVALRLHGGDLRQLPTFAKGSFGPRCA
jgi:hypothetical protein